jgi:hypothetical protein
MINIVTDIAARYELKKSGRRYYGRCPACGGSKTTNRFNLMDDGGFKCYSCDFKGDIITWLREMENKSCPEAHEYAGQACNSSICPAAPKCRLGSGGAVTAPRPRRRLEPQAPPRPAALPFSPTPDPRAVWRTWAESFVNECAQNIPRDIFAYLAGRGLDRQAVERFRIGWHPKKRHVARELLGLTEAEHDRPTIWIPPGIVLVVADPDRSGRIYRLKIRRQGEDLAAFLPEQKYWAIKGSGKAPMVIRPVKKCRGVLVIEAELDGQAAAMAHDNVLVVALGTTAAPIDPALRAEIAAAPVVMVGLDADGPDQTGQPGPGPKKVSAWCAEFPQAKYWPVPYGKDVGEYFEQSGNVGLWLEAGLLPAPKKDDAMTPPLLVDLGARESGLPQIQTPAVNDHVDRLGSEIPLPDLIPALTGSGRKFGVARTKAVWLEEVKAGRVVFSAGEVSCLQKVLPVPPGFDDQLFDIKAIFSGAYISAGRVVCPESPDSASPAE